ncbi:MAG: ROK family protein [Firmicutes bacterium]|nr:ROK family protein [Bacillota bacterium]
MSNAIVGIDLGGTNAQGAALVNGKLSESKAIPTRARQGPEAIMDDLADLAHELAAGAPLAAVGLGVPGLLDLERGVCVFSGNLNWREFPIVEKLEQRLGASVFIDNDVRVAALGELSQGKAQGCRDFIYLTVGTGIGSGIFIDGRLLRGPRWSAGEVGHMVLNPHGPDCTCGSRGCLEALAAAPAIARDGRKAAARYPESLLNEMSAGDPNRIDAALVSRATDAGDAIARQVFAEAMDWLGIGIANLVNIFNPELVVIGGGVSLAGEKLLTPVGAKIEQYSMPVQKQNVRLELSALADKAGVYGALELATRQTTDKE